MSSLRIWMIGALCLGFAACAKSRGPEAGTNTNWLKRCTASTDCDDAGDCLCGVCTVSCSDNSSCAEVGKQTSCVPMSRAPMCATSANGSACLPSGDPEPAAQPSAEDAGVALHGDCFSPTQNLDRANDPGAVGCACRQVGLEICIGGVSLVCSQGEDSPSTWTTSAASSCATPCPGNALRDSPDACLAEFGRCVEQPDGEFCGTNCLGAPIDCSTTQCQYTPADLSMCGLPGASLQRGWEGLCGDVRYRSESNGTGGVTSYWSAATGELLARVSSTDNNIYCNSAATEFIDGDLSVVAACEVVRDDTTLLCPPAVTCSTAARRPDMDACLAEFATCTEQPDGGFCGTGCRGPLVCDQPEDCTYTQFDPADCGNPYPNIWEGTCGAIRYRSESGGFGGPTWYWNATTGELLAMTSSNDIPTFCNGAEFDITLGDLTVVQDCTLVFDATTALCP